MSLQFKGRLETILPLQTGNSKNGNTWKKQEFVVETEEQFPKKVCLSLFNDKISQLEGLTPNDQVEVYFSVESREFNGKWYHNINAWKIEKAQAQNGNSPIPEYRMDDIPPELPENNDLPF
ncbi:MAG: DUF3127 domain-containing protein [Bacteroidota bacterium]|nr:DUF3127 domain-containing protein [Bacteroidota bacterium]MDP4206211.1 DUF3127 domain-containing protein [Bacteroidota bacterium]